MKLILFRHIKVESFNVIILNVTHEANHVTVTVYLEHIRSCFIILIMCL